LELLKADPPSSAKPELEQHITYQTRLLIAFEEPFNAAERERRHNGFGLVAGAGIPIGLATLELTEESPSIPQVVIGWIIGGVFYVWGFVLVASTGTS